MAKLKEEVLKACLKKKYQSKGFRLYQLDDHVIVLDYKDKTVARFSATGATVAGVNKACEEYLTGEV